jgi:hypothetical protein
VLRGSFGSFRMTVLPSRGLSVQASNLALGREDLAPIGEACGGLWSGPLGAA